MRLTLGGDPHFRHGEYPPRTSASVRRDSGLGLFLVEGAQPTISIAAGGACREA